MMHIVTALQCEAKAMIKHYGLQHLAGSHPYPIYLAQDMVLIVSGVGKIAAAAATAYLYAVSQSLLTVPDKDIGTLDSWLNIGMAGHGTSELGTGLLAHTIIDAASEQCWYPSIAFAAPCTSICLQTVDIPKQDYDQDHAYDMEASGFYGTASKFTALELVHCYKIVSDNQQSASDRISAALAQQWVHQCLDDIDALRIALDQLGQANKHDTAVTQATTIIRARWHFSVYQQHQLQRLLQRWQALDPMAVATLELPQLKTASDLIAWLQQQLDHSPLLLAH